MTKVTTVKMKEPFVVLQRLRSQDVAGLKLKSSDSKTISLRPSTRGTKDSNVKEGRCLNGRISSCPSTRGTKDSNVKEGRCLNGQISLCPSTRGTKDSNGKGHCLNGRDEITTNGEITAPEDGVQGAADDGESCLPTCEEGSKEHHCFRCSMNFPNSDTLVLHLKSHGPIRRSCTLYEKEVCGTSIDDSGQQNRRTMASTSKQGESSSRMRKETAFGEMVSSLSGESRFPCNVCNKVFMQSNHLKLHMRTHSESKTGKERSTDSEDENSPPVDSTAFIKKMKNVIEESAIKCFTDALETNNLPSSSDEALDRIRIRAREAWEKYCSNSEGLLNLKQQREDDIKHTLQNLDYDSLNIKEEGKGDGFDKNVVSVNSHRGSFNGENSLQNHQASIKSNSENESSAGVQDHTSASDKHTENVEAASVGDSVSCSVQNVLENKISPPVPDTEKSITTKITPSEKDSAVSSVPPTEPGQSNKNTAKTSKARQKTRRLTTYQGLMVRRSKKLFPCKICHKVFSLQSHLKLHHGNVHGTKQSKQFAEDTDSKEDDEDIAKDNELIYQRNMKRCSKLINGPFHCSLCDKEFTSECLLNEHEKSHSEEIVYNCTKCQKAFELKEDLLLHMSQEHPVSQHSLENTNKMINETLLISPNSYKCLECNIHTCKLHVKSDHTDLYNSDIHMTPTSTSDLSPPIVCIKCNYHFYDGSALERHLQICSSCMLEKENRLHCSNCSMKFPDDILLEDHMKLCHSKLVLKCRCCNLNFSNGNALQSHMKHHSTRSTTSTPSKCSKCDLKFANDALLQTHMQLLHSMFQSSNQHICSKCGKKLKSQALLNLHTLAHSPELEEAKKVLTCSTCGMKFSDGSSFHSHIKHHTSFVQKYTESCNITMSENEMVVKLSDPDSRIISMQKNKLQNKRKSMDNTRTTFQCSQCDMHFRERNELQSHMKLNHALELKSQHSEVNITRYGSANNLQSSSRAQKKLMFVSKDLQSDPIPVPEKSQTSSQLLEADFECSECNIQFCDFDNLQTHMKLNHTQSVQNPKMKVTKTPVTESKQTSVHNGAPLKYNVLSSKPTSTASYPLSRRAESFFGCSKCDRIFKGKESLQKHIDMQHSPTPERTTILKCLRCLKQFNTSSQFRSHLRTHRKMPCPHCDKYFTTRDSLNKHMSIHARYKCDICSSQFSSSVLFKKHLKLHVDDICLAIEDRGDIQKVLKTGNESQSVAAAEISQNTPDSLLRIDNVKHFGVSTSDDSETMSHNHLDEENLVTVDGENLVTIDDDDDDEDDVVILSEDENTVNKENHNTDEVELETDDEIMVVLDNTSPGYFEELSNKQLQNRTPEISAGVQTEAVLSHESTAAFLTDHKNKTTSSFHTADDTRSLKRIPLVTRSAVPNNDSFERHGSVDHSSGMVSTEIVNRSADSSCKLSSSFGRSTSPDISRAVRSIIESLSDPQDTVQLENYHIVKKSRNAPVISSKRKRILKDANRLVGLAQKKKKMLRVSFADGVSEIESDTSMYSESMERTMPKLSPEKVTVDSNKIIAFQNNVKHPTLFKNNSVSPTKSADSTLGTNANKISTPSNENASQELLKRRESTTNRIYGEKKVNDDESQKFIESLKTGDQELPLPVEAKNTSTPKESNKLGTRTRHHYFSKRNVVHSPDEVENGQMVNKSRPVATSTPLKTNKLNRIRTADSSIHYAKAEILTEKDGQPAEDVGPRNKLSLFRNTIPHLESKNRTSTSHGKETLEPPKPTYTQKKNSQSNIGKFKCKVCGKVFQCLANFQVHRKIHRGRLRHKCPICNNRFPFKFLLGLHIADHFQKGIPRMISEYKIPSPNKSPTSTSKNFAPKFHIPKKKISPGTQDNNAPRTTEPSFSSVFSHSSNASTATSDGPTNQINSLVQHHSLPSKTNKDHSSPLPQFDHSNESNENYSSDKQFYQCDDSVGSHKQFYNCDDTVHSDQQFYQRDDSVGYSPSLEKNLSLEFACGKCDKKFTNHLKLKLHQSTHTGVGLYRCCYCDLMFHFKPSLLSHVKSHSGKKKYACKYCGKLFEEQHVMVKHRIRHEDGKRPFRCLECPKTFALDSTLRAHMQLHVRRSLYKCTFCNCSFSVKANFQYHIVTHTEKKPYICKICKFATKRMDVCRNHIKLVHIPRNEITLKGTQTAMDFVQIDTRIYEELQDFVKDILNKTRLGGEGISHIKSVKDSTVPIDQELPEPILVDPRRLQDSFVKKEIIKSKANCTLSDLYSADMNKKERYEKLCVEVRNVLTRMKRYSQIPTMSPSRNQTQLETPTKQIQGPRMRKSLNLSKNRSPNNLTDSSKNKQEASGNLNKSVDRTLSREGSIVVKSSEKSTSLDKKSKKTMQIYKDIIAAKLGRPCKYCGEVFSERFMKTHEQSHTGGGEHLCSFCDKRFTTKVGLRYHLALHADVRPYPCTICGRAFKLKHQMYAHVRKHTSERKHKCKICSKSFRSKGNLHHHILTHIPKEERPFKCKQCDQRFSTKYALGLHDNRHKGVKPYECDVCCRKFSDKGSAYRHVRTMHAGKNHMSKDIAQADA